MQRPTARRRRSTTRFSPVRLVSIGDVNAEFGSLAARRFGYERNDTSWQAIAAADDIDVVSVVIANSLHREVVEGLLAAGKHVLREKPLSDTLEDGAQWPLPRGSLRPSRGSDSPTAYARDRLHP
jgi:predicted dehydrogenase